MLGMSASMALALALRVTLGSTSAGPPLADRWRGRARGARGRALHDRARVVAAAALARPARLRHHRLHDRRRDGVRRPPRLPARADTAGEEVRLLGYSRGGQFARVLTQDPTVPVRSLPTLGTPFDLYGLSRPCCCRPASSAAVVIDGSGPRRPRISGNQRVQDEIVSQCRADEPDGRREPRSALPEHRRRARASRRHHRQAHVVQCPPGAAGMTVPPASTAAAPARGAATIVGNVTWRGRPAPAPARGRRNGPGGGRAGSLAWRG